jgi:hypothetical protein
MVERCTNPNHVSYKNYGGRDIGIDERWLRFENFFADMGERPGRGRAFSIERIDNSKGYCKSNCRWATPTEQANNRSGNVVVHCGDMYGTVREWERNLRIPRGWLNNWLRAGGTLESYLYRVPGSYSAASDRRTALLQLGVARMARSASKQQ